MIKDARLHGRKQYTADFPGIGEGDNEVSDMSKNAEMIQQLKTVKGILVSKELRGDDWEEMQSAVSKLEEVVSYINDCSGKGIQF